MPTVTKSKRYFEGKPNLVTIHPPGTLKDYPFNIAPYKKSYTDFFRLAEKYFSVFYVRDKKRHLGQGVFKQGYRFQQGKFIPYNAKIYARVVYNKTTLYSNGGKNWDVVNKWNLYKITFNKYRSYQLFKQYMKPTYRIRNKAQFLKTLPKIKTDWVVYKPNRGAEGKGIIIGPKKTVAKKLANFKLDRSKYKFRRGAYDGLLQEFIDTSGGIPNLHHTYHDMRILIMNGKIVQTYIRIPKKGSFLANVARGGALKEIPIKKVPRSAKSIALKIDTKLKKYGARVYAIDFGFEDGKPYLFEINPQPGLPYPSWHMYYRKWHKSLLSVLLSCLK